MALKKRNQAPRDKNRYPLIREIQEKILESNVEEIKMTKDCCTLVFRFREKDNFTENNDTYIKLHCIVQFNSFKFSIHFSIKFAIQYNSFI